MRDWLRTRIRAYLGTANIDPRLLPHLRRQEVMIARLHEAVTALNRQPTGIPDNDREHPVTQPTLAGLIRHWLGTDRIPHMEATMATAREQLETLNSKVDDLIADVRAARDTLAAERENLTADGQAAFDTLSAKIDAADTEVGDADGSDTPTEPAPAEPAADDLAVPGNIDPADGAPTDNR